MRRWLLCLVLVSPLGCATSQSWLNEFDNDPDLRTDYIWGEPDTSRARADMATDTQIRTDRPAKP